MLIFSLFLLRCESFLGMISVVKQPCVYESRFLKMIYVGLGNRLKDCDVCVLPVLLLPVHLARVLTQVQLLDAGQI